MMGNYCMRSFLLCLFCCVVLLDESYGVDYWYTACAPRNCGSSNLTIEYPFYIPNESRSNCGYPHSEIFNCNQFKPPLLNFSGTDLAIKNISYESKTLSVYDAAVESSCLSGFKNLSLPVYFRVVTPTNLRLFYDCNITSLPNHLVRRRVACDENGEDRSVWPLYEKEENFTTAVANCNKSVKVPVEVSRDHRITGMDDLKAILLRGFVLNWTISDCVECKMSRGYCGYNRTNLHFRCFCTDRPHSRSCKPDSHLTKAKARSKLIPATAITGGVAALILVSVLISVLIWQRKERIKKACAFSGSISKPELEGAGTYFGIPVFSYTELKVATKNFDSSKELGDGGFGTVYYGKLQDGREVAVKRLYEHNCRRMEQYMNEISILASLRHPNLVSLYGCTSRKSKELLLVYEYISNGTVTHHLHGEFAQKSPLSWPVRMKIAIELANALAYLHKSDIIHRDVKTDNILLDDNFCVKVADFGLSRLFPNDVTHVSTAPLGTPGYVDPEYHQCYHLTDKSDVYSFGVVLIELISSMPAVDINRHRHEINLANLAVNKIQARAFDELIDASLGYNTDAEITRMTVSVAELAFRCLQLEKDMRPSMDEVLETLKEILGSDDKTGFDQKISFSPETDDVVLLKKKFQSSPNAVTDVWYSSSPASDSVV